MTQSQDPRFENLLEPRSEKPRKTGQTMVIGDGVYNIGGMNYLEDLVAFVGPWIDSYKFQRGALGLQSPDLIQSKLALFEQHDITVFPGGNFFEAAFHQRMTEAYMTAIDEIGCPGIEISSTSINLEPQDKGEIVEQAAGYDFHVHAEIGKKATETGGEMLSEEEVREEIEIMLDAGADIIILEMEQLQQMDIESDNGDIMNAIVNDFGSDKLLFELPIASYYEVMETSWWYIDRVGPEVNLGNVNPQHVMPLEQQRRGLGQYAFTAMY